MHGLVNRFGYHDGGVCAAAADRVGVEPNLIVTLVLVISLAGLMALTLVVG